MSSNNKPIISLNQLTISTAKARLIDGLTLDVHQGEIIGVVGVSGMGKTSLMLSLFGLLSPSWTVSAQQAMIAGLVIPMARQGDDRAFGEVRRQMAYIFQEPKASLNPVDTIATSFDKLFATLNIPKHERKSYAKQLLEMVHLPDTERYLSAYPHELSGGEARRISIAQALAGTPKVIIADEPTGALDSHLKDEMLTLLTDLCHRTGTALLIISHDLPSLMGRCDRFLVIGADGCDTLTPQTIIHNPTAHALLIADFGTPPVMPDVMDNQSPVLSIHDLTIHHAHRWLFWRKSSPVIEKFNLQVHQGEIVGIMGVSGVGKSTLARAITRLDPRLIVSGRIIINGQDIYQLSATRLRHAKRQAILVMQEVKDSLNPTRTIRQSLDEACDTADDAYLDELLALCGLSKSLLERYPSGLSGGECQRICIVRALLARPKLLILDEPTAMLDRLSIARLLDLLRKINQTYQTAILIISHDPMVIDALCHRTIHLQKSVSLA
ncbi:ABC transporter ATP-binding protein [Moraxella pluranimalium]|uniref:ABC transporter domain-containing protein n=1 Tax=Moraxella pluranimalium TaxID=470453 RepID=A0A1T0CS44_9GAMM|nr:ATP-binding cassette domain-containing protein [Moraxella pluranimalium]OOS25134.1 hypothetical protein B0680_03290 [Moraxella pluranimalium]